MVLVMIAEKQIPVLRVLKWTLPNLFVMLAWATAAACLYHFAELPWLTIPWLPLSLIGTAVAFYCGFKNNSAYDRMWEARKIWGAIVNSSRAWGTYVRTFTTAQFAEQPVSDAELHEIHRRLIYRHIAWLYSLRSQLLVPAEWEHSAQGGKTGKTAARYQREFGVGLIDDEITKEELHRFLPPEEYEKVILFRNTATQLIDKQGCELVDLRARGLIEDFRHMELQKLLANFYEHQGKCERIKKFPLPRQYANSGSIFVGLFLLLLPFGMVTEFARLGEHGVWWSIPFTTLVGWVFHVMESVGDSSENPFQGMANDVPTYSLCRTIEIDLREMLGEAEIPPAITSKNGILM